MFQKLLYFDQARESELGDGEELRKAFERCKMSRQTTNKLSREFEDCMISKIHGWAKKWSPGFNNLSGKLRQKE